jgi:hypothetical protein
MDACLHHHKPTMPVCRQATRNQANRQVRLKKHPTPEKARQHAAALNINVAKKEK